MDIPIVEHCSKVIHLLAGQNPIQVLVEAIINSGPPAPPKTLRELALRGFEARVLQQYITQVYRVSEGPASLPVAVSNAVSLHSEGVKHARN